MKTPLGVDPLALILKSVWATFWEDVMIWKKPIHDELDLSRHVCGY